MRDTIQGQNNQLPHPVYLPPVHIENTKTVGGNQDVTLTIPGFQGFKMIVKANSVTFPDGSNEGELVVNPVHNDRLPMVPPGTGGRFMATGWTLQPTGTRFDPPIEVHIPNTDGLKPGTTVPIVQWDHDMAYFVPMGQGTISEDGTVLVSNEGSGITKAGWGGAPNPVQSNNTCTDNSGSFMNPNESDWEIIVNPLIDWTSPILKQGLLGITKDSFNGSNFKCVRSTKCGTYKIQGGIGITDNISVAKNIPTYNINGTINGFVPRKTKPINFIQKTITHEKLHANHKQSLKEKWYSHSELNDEWDTLIECELVKGNENQNPPFTIQPDTIEGKNQIEYNIEHYQQCIHRDHDGEAMQSTDGNGNEIDLKDRDGDVVSYPLTSTHPLQAAGFSLCQDLKKYPLPHEY